MTRSFLFSATSVLTGTLIAQLIPIIGTLVLARFFSPSSFGIFSTWLGGVLFLAIILSGRFEVSLAIERDGGPRRISVAMTLLTIALTFLVALTIFLLAILCGVHEYIEFPLLLLFMIVPTAALVSIAQTFQNWAAADGRYKQLSYMRIIQSFSSVVIQIIFGLFSPDALGLIFGYFFGVLIGLLMGWFLEPMARIDFSSPLTSLKRFWREKKHFPIFSLPADSINAAAAQLPVILVAAKFGAEAAGLLAMALRILGGPMSLLSASVLDVFKRHAGKAYLERGECRSEYLHAFRILMIFAVFAGVAIGVGVESFFLFAFGDEWLGAGAMALWLLPRFIVGFIASPLSYMTYVAGKQHLDLIWQLVLLGMTIFTLSFFGSIQIALMSYAFGYSCLYVVYLMMSYRFSFGRIR